MSEVFSLLLTILFSVASSVAAAQSVASASRLRPQIIAVEGQAWVATGPSEQAVAAKVQLPLVEKAFFKTQEGEVRLRLAKGRELLIRPHTEVDIPIIGWDQGEISRVVLKQGEVRWQGSGDDEVALHSSLFEINIPNGDFLFHFDPKIPQAGVMVMSGQIDFSATNGEEVKTVKTGQHLVFKGVIEDGEIAADLLLKGKRIPRGQLGSVEKMPASELAKFEIEQRAKASAAATKIKSEVAKKEKMKRSGLICARPAGKFGECAWTCTGAPKKAKKCPISNGATCVRTRCNANGVWADRIVLESDDALLACEDAGTTIKPCP